MKIFLSSIIFLFSLHTYSQYTDYQSPFYGSLNSGDFASYPFGNQAQNHAWLCGDSSMIMKIYPYSMPPGFRNVKGNIPTGFTFNSICSIDTVSALVGGNSGSNCAIFKTSNNGSNWVQCFSQVNGYIVGIWFKTQLNGLLIGNPQGGRWSVFKTVNGGITWDSAGLYLPQANSESSLSNNMFVRGDTVWLGTNNSRIYISYNFGSTWNTRIIFGAGAQNIRAVNNDLNSNSGFIAGDSLYQTYSWGNNWSVVPNTSGIGPITSLVASNPGVDASSMPLFYSKQNNLYYSFGWSLFHSASSGVYTYLFKLRPYIQYSYTFSPMLGLMNNGKVWICICAWGGIRQTNNIIPDKFILEQNYPNPFNPVTKIRFAVPKGKQEIVKLSIYNPEGKEIIILHNGTMAEGNYEADFDGSNFASGVYYYKLESGDNVITKKMVLLK